MSDVSAWQDMATAPRNGTTVLVEVRATEQGPAEVDIARWARPGSDGEERWISEDSDPAMPVFYSDVELKAWTPLTTPLPELRKSRLTAGGTGKAGADEGSGI